jgi:hypothetical protein
MHTCIHVFKNTQNFYFYFLKNSHKSSYNFSDSIQFNVGCGHITLLLLLEPQARFLHIISKNTKERYRTLSHTPFLS